MTLRDVTRQTGRPFMRKPLPIGISDFKRIREGNYAYVDKTLLIQEIVEHGGIVALIARPRRFGKTLNLSTLRYFFEKTKEDNSILFKSLNIWEDDNYRKLQGQFPVIFITLKDVKHTSWEKTFSALRIIISDEFLRHSYLLEGNHLAPHEKKRYQKIIALTEDIALYEASLRLLTEWLHRYHGKKVILLLDEYDSPAHAAFVGDFYDELISFLRNWLSGAIKDNVFLERSVLTGILRIAKESIFSGLNNVTSNTILDETFRDKFGLLESEVNQLLEQYALLHKQSEIKQWYNGYRIGSCEQIYNPWSVLECIRKEGSLAPYWVNTSDNALVKKLITQGPSDVKTELEQLLNGNIIEKTIDDGIVFATLERSSNAIWSLLLFSGYLTLAAPPSYGTPCQLRISNKEIGELYQSMVIHWFSGSIQESHYHIMLNSLISGDIEIFSKIFQEFLASSVSIFDVSSDQPEKIYHAFVLGMLIGLRGRYEVKSNRESGYGRYDVMLIPNNKDELGIIMEFKKVSQGEQMDLETAVALAIKQIEDRNYKQELLDRRINQILYLALAFKGKKVLIKDFRI